MNTGFTPPDGGFVMPFDVNAYLNALPAYQHSEVAVQRLDNLRRFQEDGNYVSSIRACPTTLQQTSSNVVAANAMFEDQISVPEGSFLLMIGGVSVVSAGVFGKFRIRIYDVGSQCYLSDDFVGNGNISGYHQANQTGFVNGATVGQVGQNGLFMLESPIAVASPGQLAIQFVNLEASQVTIDMAFYFASPIHNKVEVTPAWASNVQDGRNYV